MRVKAFLMIFSLEQVVIFNEFSNIFLPSKIAQTICTKFTRNCNLTIKTKNLYYCRNPGNNLIFKIISNHLTAHIVTKYDEHFHNKYFDEKFQNEM